MGWFVYMLRCSDDTLYTGVTTDVARRLTEHNGRTKGAKYTKARQPVELVYSKKVKDRSSAQIKEAQLRRLTRAEKLLLVNKG
jgi:putative endonuclease